MKTVRRLFAVLATLLLLTSGCGGDADNSAESLKDQAEQLSDKASDEVDLGDLEDLAGAANLLSDQCEFLFTLATAPGLVAAGQMDIATLEGIDAPDEIAEDVKVYVAALSIYVKDPANNAAALSGEDFTEAAERIGDYAEANCQEFTG